MRYTERDLELFKALSKSGLGKDLVDYIDRLTTDLCDARTWGKDDTKESVLRAAQYLKSNLRDKIVPTKENLPPRLNDFQ